MSEARGVWCLDWHEVGTTRRIRIETTPFRVGRRNDLQLSLPCAGVSGVHAELISDNESLWVRDLQSTNGTYVNGKRVSQAVRLTMGDLVQFATVVFRVAREAEYDAVHTREDQDSYDQALALIQFEKLIVDRAITPHYQPIIETRNKETVGFEVLARSRLFGLQNPSKMFHAASLLHLEAELSRIARWEGVRGSEGIPNLANLFLNTHPAEFDTPEDLYTSLRDVRKRWPNLKITLELHEEVVADTPSMHELRAVLNHLQIGVAYDDFGAGQARLLELVKVPPDYLKFDMQLVQGIHEAPAVQQQMLGTLVRMVRDIGVKPLAEGIECEADGELCREMGFELSQGFLYGRPAPAESHHRGLSVSRP